MISETIENITEKVIEDIFSADKSILANVLSLNQGDLSLIARQKKFDSKKILDLLYLYQNELMLIELKAVPFYDDIISQINDYYDELIKLQSQSKLIRTRINKVILVPYAHPKDFHKCSKHKIRLVKFNLEEVLTQYYNNFKELSTFLRIQPGNWGVTRLYLLKNTLTFLSKSMSIEEIAKIENRSIKTIRNRLAVANLMGLLEKENEKYSLSKFGYKLISLENKYSQDKFSAEQFELMAEFIKENPFFSQITFSIMSVVDTIFILSKAEYPVNYDTFQDFFVRSLGKDKTWTKPRAQLTGTYHFMNYAEELGFIQKVDNNLFLTPGGIQAILIFQLNRSIKLINARR